jgi:hypothetical protein
MSSKDLTRFSIIDSLPDPLLSWKWVCTFLPTFDGANGIPVAYVENVSLPFASISPKAGLFGGGTYTYYPAFEDISAFDVVFYEDKFMGTTKWIKSWYDAIRNPANGAYYLPTSYKRDMRLELHNQEGSKVAEVVLQNIWPTAKGNWDMDYTSDSRLQVHQNFSIDSAKITFVH